MERSEFKSKAFVRKGNRANGIPVVGHVFQTKVVGNNIYILLNTMYIMKLILSVDNLTYTYNSRYYTGIVCEGTHPYLSKFRNGIQQDLLGLQSLTQGDEKGNTEDKKKVKLVRILFTTNFNIEEN